MRLRIDAPPPNGKVHSAVILVFRDDGQLQATDRADLYSLLDTQRTAKRLAKHLGKDAGDMETAIRAEWLRVLDAQPKPAWNDVDLTVYASCKQIGSNVRFVRNPVDAFQQAKAEKKMVFIAHLSGNLEDRELT